jgi:hypothetical protein
MTRAVLPVLHATGPSGTGPRLGNTGPEGSAARLEEHHRRLRRGLGGDARTHPQAVRRLELRREPVQPGRPRRRLTGDSRANLITVTDDPQENENRKDRDRERSDEAHWCVAKEGAEDQDDGPKPKTEKGQEGTCTADS